MDVGRSVGGRRCRVAAVALGRSGAEGDRAAHRLQVGTALRRPRLLLVRSLHTCFIGSRGPVRDGTAPPTG